jgi:hypothetical protein
LVIHIMLKGAFDEYVREMRYFCPMKDEQERKRLLPYVIAIIIIGGAIIIALVDWLFSL